MRRRKRPLVDIQVESPAAADRQAKLADQLKEDARSGLPGLGVSMLVHAGILALLALIVVRGSGLGNQDPLLEFGWISAAASRSSQDEGRPIDIPLNIAPSRPVPVGTSDGDGSSAKKTDAPGPSMRSVPVQPADVKNILNGRDRDKRGKMLEKHGGGDDTERAVTAGLNWLKRRQRAAGNWSLHEGYPDAGYRVTRTDTGATALALLAFLGTGHTHLTGDFTETVDRGLNWLMGIQKSNGDYHDHVELGRETAFFAHSQAVMAICEAYAMTGDERLRESAQAGVAYLIDSQQPLTGGWKFMPQDPKTVGNLAVTGWCLMALHTARVAGFDVPQESFELSSSFLDTVQAANGARYKAEASYSADSVSVAMTAEGLLCRQFLGWPADHPQLLQGVKFITQPAARPEWTEGRRNVYEWYYVGHVLHNVGGQPWKDWYQAVQAAIVPEQERRGSTKGDSDVRGSWHPTQPRGAPFEYAEKGGRLYVTAMSILILELPYRHLPLYED